MVLPAWCLYNVVVFFRLYLDTLILTSLSMPVTSMMSIKFDMNLCVLSLFKYSDDDGIPCRPEIMKNCLPD